MQMFNLQCRRSYEAVARRTRPRLFAFLISPHRLSTRRAPYASSLPAHRHGGQTCSLVRPEHICRVSSRRRSWIETRTGQRRNIAPSSARATPDGYTCWSRPTRCLRSIHTYRSSLRRRSGTWSSCLPHSQPFALMSNPAVPRARSRLLEYAKRTRAALLWTAGSGSGSTWPWNAQGALGESSSRAFQGGGAALMTHIAARCPRQSRAAQLAR